MSKRLSSLKNTLLYKTLLPWVMRVLWRCRPSLAPRILLLTPNIIVKYGSDDILSEALAIQFVSKNTTIPVPHIIRLFRSHDGSCYLLMKRCPGIPLSQALHSLSLEERRSAFQQLRGYMDELRSLEPPRPGGVGSAEFGPLDDRRVYSSSCGPFESVAEFHRKIRNDLESPTGHEECDNLIAAQDS